jgi:uncharacterized protein (TIGR00661 family)
LKILFAIQGTGNGHISRARDLVPLLKEHAETDVLISGIQADVDPGFETQFRLHGMGFIFGKKGSVDFIRTFRKCISRRFLQEVRELPVDDYDLVINDFEPVSAWAARLKGIPCISLSHQYAVVHGNSPRSSKKDWMGKMILAYYAPVQKGYGFHFQPYAPNIFTPVIRQEIRNLRVSEGNYATVYLPAYDDERITRVLEAVPGVQWQVFSRHCLKETKKDNIWIRPIENKAFLRSMAGSRAVLCGAGFETPAEALYLGKKLLVIPMKNQFEQQCNAAALEQMGVKTMKSLKRKHAAQIGEWLENGLSIRIQYPDLSRDLIRTILQDAQELPKPQPLSLMSFF